MKLRQDEVIFHERSYADPSGRVFHWNGGLYRAIGHGRVDFFKKLFADGVIQELVQKKYLIDTEPADIELEGYGWVLKHRIIPVESYGFEWCDEMLKAAALSVVDLQAQLFKHRLMLKDPHPWNLLFEGAAPVWVDLGSITELPSDRYIESFEIFHAYFTRPLKMMAAGHERIARLLMRDEFQGVTDHEEKLITSPIRTELSERRERLRARFDAVVSLAIPWKLKRLWARLQPSGNVAAKQDVPAFLSSLRREIENINFPRQVTDWSEYDSSGFATFEPSPEWSLKQQSVYQILQKEKPASVTEIGSNRGWYSQLAVRAGARVVSLDNDGPSIAKLFRDASTGNLPILPLLIDFRELNLQPDSGRGGRFRSEMVFALALVHHLVFRQSMKFAEIIRLIAEMSGKSLVIEFIGRDDPHIQAWLTDQFDWYSLENFVEALETQFQYVSRLPSNLESRVILFCQK